MRAKPSLSVASTLNHSKTFEVNLIDERCNEMVQTNQKVFVNGLSDFSSIFLVVLPFQIKETGGLHLGTFTGQIRSGAIYSGGKICLTCCHIAGRLSKPFHLPSQT